LSRESSVDQPRLDQIRRSLEADDYRIDVAVGDGRADVAIAAGPAACAECLVSKDLMRSMLAPVLGVPPDRIELAYPADVDH
jgi:DNA-binding transcriptional LysR family regulator